jgi:hypothetical protein
VVAAIEQFARQVQQHRQHQAVGGIAVQAAHDAAQPPLLVGVVLDRGVDVLDAGVEDDEEIDAGGQRDPEEIEAERAQVAPGIGGGTEEGVEEALDALQQGESAQADGFDCAHVGGTRGRVY